MKDSSMGLFEVGLEEIDGEIHEYVLIEDAVARVLGEEIIHNLFTEEELASCYSMAGKLYRAIAEEIEKVEQQQ